MPSASRPAFLRSFGLSPDARRAPDLADMGTAFALDEALDRAGPAAYSATEPPPIRAAVRVAPWRLWLGRKLGS